MSGTVRIALAQFDFPVGAVAANAQRVIELIAQARDQLHADIVVFPEMTLPGIPAGNLLLRPAFQRDCIEGLERISIEAQGIVAVVGWSPVEDGVPHSAISVLRDGYIASTHRKRLALSDLQAEPCIIECNGVRVGVMLDEDDDAACELGDLSEHALEVALITTGSAFARGRCAHVQARLAAHARQSGVALAWVNRVGGQDDLVFNGCSLLIDGDGLLHPVARAFEPQLLVADIDGSTRRFTPLRWDAETDADQESLVWRALVHGTRDYLHKNGFQRAWIGLSGGVDSALVLAIAVEALGAENITAVRLPSRYTAAMSNDLAAEQANTLGVRLQTVPIEMPFEAFLEALAPLFADREPDVTEENLQSRCRGVLMMALSNKFGGMVLTTGNKSELAVGYGTIYGDTCGGFAPLKDLYKSQIFELCRWRNAQGDGERIPVAVIERPPSAELRDNQRDDDSLPPYPLLDDLLARHLDRGESSVELIADGFDPDVVRRVLRLVKISEWKRQQYAPGPQLTDTIFGSPRRQPITSGYEG